jgi:hypothetical protein
VGRISPLYVFASNFCVTPCIAVSAARPAFRPNPDEVDRVLELPVASLLDPACRGVHELRCGGICFRAPSIAHDGYHIWGATCMILAELAAVLRELEGDPASGAAAARGDGV